MSEYIKYTAEEFLANAPTHVVEDFLRLGPPGYAADQFLEEYGSIKHPGYVEFRQYPAGWWSYHIWDMVAVQPDVYFPGDLDGNYPGKWFMGEVIDYTALVAQAGGDMQTTRYREMTHCLVCQGKLIYRYPLGDPENGYPIKFCPKCRSEFEPCEYPGCGRIFHNFEWNGHTSWDDDTTTPEEV